MIKYTMITIINELEIIYISCVRVVKILCNGCYCAALLHSAFSFALVNQGGHGRSS